MKFILNPTQIQAETVEIRRYLHRIPELSFQEFQTSSFIAEKLKALNFEVTTGIGKTGVVGLMRGTKKDLCILLRFDMDALPIEEQTNLPFRSRNEGKMHACGHDAHMAIGLTVARKVSEMADHLGPTIKLVFQPAEEIGKGALAMIEDGVLENPTVNYAIGLHVWNEKPLHWVGIASGPIMAGSDMFTIRLHGKGGHGAAPHQAIDSIVAAACVVNSLQSIVARNIDPLSQAVVSVGTIHGGTASNILPESVEISGTIRYFNSSTQELIHQRIHEITKGIASAHNCTTEVEIIQSTRPVCNDKRITEIASEAITGLRLGLEVDREYRTLLSEDMSFFLERVPGVYLFFGSGNKDEKSRFPHHHPKFNFEEECMGISVSAILALIQTLSAEFGG